MSGLAGLWNLDGRPVDASVLASMAATIVHRGTDHSGTWIQGPIGFACQLLRVTPESAAERQPLTDDSQNTLVFDGRLDNRDELRAAVAARGCAPPGTADSELLSAAWRVWGDDCLPKVNGSFALAYFDQRLRRLTLARDAVGCRPLYYWRDGKTFVFASEAKAILAHPAVRVEPNADLIADLFLLDQLPYEDDGETYFAGIRAVLPGRRTIATSSHTWSERFWDFDPRHQVRYRSYQDYAQHFKALLIQAVQRCVRSSHPVAVACSGGLDSSVVLCMADDLRSSGSLSAALLPVSYTPTDNLDTDENKFIRLLEAERRLHVQRVGIGDTTDAAQLKLAAWHSETPVFDRSWCWETPLLGYAHEQGARTVLTGLWSDQVFFVMGYLVDIFATLAWHKIPRHLKEYRKWYVDVDGSYFRARLARELFLNFTPSVVRSLLRPFRTAIGHRGKQAELKLSRELVRRARRRRPHLVHPPYATAHAKNIYQTVRSKYHRLQFEADEKIAYRYGVERVTPFLDREVIGFLMSIPGEIQTHGGVPRALLREAMRGIAPNPILGRRWPDEKGSSTEIERRRREAEVAAAPQLRACQALGFRGDVSPTEAGLLELLGLEFWSRVFFSGSLEPI